MKHSGLKGSLRAVLTSAKAHTPWLIAFFLIATLAMGQERFGELRGEATDSTGAVLPNVTVNIKNKESNRVYTAKTAGDGAYYVRSLDPGRYSVTFELTGFTTYEVPEVLVAIGRNLKVDATLAVGQTGQQIQVTEAAPLIDTSGTLVSTNVLAEEFDRLPKGRSFQSLVQAAPSVNVGDIEGGIQINGASGAENQFNIDGVSTTSLISGKSRQNAAFEYIQEVQVKTSGLDAEYGGALGGVISAVTKSGGNDFHGDLHYYWSSNAISAGQTRRLLLDPANETTASHVQDYKNPDATHEGGYSLGGPFIKNKLFFFSAASPQRRNANRDITQANNIRENFALERTYWQAFNKVSFAPWQRLRGTVSYLWSPSNGQGVFPTLNYYGNQATTSATSNAVQRQRGFSNPQSNYSTQIDVTVTATSILTFRAGRFWDDYKTTGIPQTSSVEYLTSATNLPFDIPANLRQATGFSNTPRLQNTFFDVTTRTYGQVDYSFYGRFLGTHNIKTGFSRQKTVNRVDESYPGGGYVQVYWNSGYPSAALGANQRGTYGYYAINDTGTRGTTGGTIDSWYVQDQYRILPRLTLSLGLRMEREKVPSFQRNIKDYAFQFGFGDKISPRLGAAYDLFGNGKVKLYGSYGRYFDWVKYELARGTFGGQIWNIYYRALDTTDVFSLSGSDRSGRNLWNNTPGSFRDRRVPAFDTVASDIKPMSQDTWNGGVEFQLANNLVFRGNYVHTNLIRTIEDLGALNANGDEVYLYANPGEGSATLMPTSGLTKPFPMPKPVRKYDAMELSLTKRFSNGLFGSVNYTLSRLYGNYAGLANSDELTSPSTGLVSAASQGESAQARTGGNVNRSWDLDEVLFDSKGNVDLQGRLATDRPHNFKLYGAKDFRWSGSQVTDIGIFQNLASGTPLSTYVSTINQIPIFVNGRGDMGRTPVLMRTDLLVGHTFKFGETKNLRFEANAINLFNQKMARGRFNFLNRGAGGAQPGSAINLSNVDLFQGFDYNSLLRTTADQLSGRGAYDSRYGLDDLFQTGFQGRLGLRFTF